MRSILLAITLVSAAYGGREVAITIDDLPRGGDGGTDAALTLRMTRKLLEPFRRERIPVTGFVHECLRPEVLQDALKLWKAAGADLGNHTCSHSDLNSTPLEAYKADILKGEKVTTKILGRRPRYFRHPFLHAGKEAETKRSITSFLNDQGYTIAPVTLDNSDYMFAAVYAKAQQRNDTSSGGPHPRNVPRVYGFDLRFLRKEIRRGGRARDQADPTHSREPAKRGYNA